MSKSCFRSKYWLKMFRIRRPTAAAADTADVEAGFVCGPCGTSSSSCYMAPTARDGPRCLNEIIGISSDLVQRLQQHADFHDPELSAEIQATLGLDVVITSAFSGTGAFEASVRQAHLGRARAPAWYSATEMDGCAQHILLNTEPKPIHVFANVEDRMPHHTRELAMAAWEEISATWQAAEGGTRDGEAGASKGDRKALLAARFLQKLDGALAQAEFNSFSWCVAHNCYCPISPRSDPRFKQMLWVEAIGPTCCPFSTMRKGGGHQLGSWIDRSTISALAYVYSAKFFEVDLILEECVLGFQEDIFDQILRAKTWETPKHVDTRPIQPDEDKPRSYVMSKLSFSPTQLGIPSMRCRKYCAYHLQPFLKPLPVNLFCDLFFSRLLVDASAYVVATPNMVEQEMRSIVFGTEWNGSGARPAPAASPRRRRRQSHIEAIIGPDAGTSVSLEQVLKTKLAIGGAPSGPQDLRAGGLPRHFPFPAGPRRRASRPPRKPGLRPPTEAISTVVRGIIAPSPVESFMLEPQGGSAGGRRKSPAGARSGPEAPGNRFIGHPVL